MQKCRELVLNKAGALEEHQRKRNASASNDAGAVKSPRRNRDASGLNRASALNICCKNGCTPASARGCRRGWCAGDRQIAQMRRRAGARYGGQTRARPAAWRPLIAGRYVLSTWSLWALGVSGDGAMDCVPWRLRRHKRWQK